MTRYLMLVLLMIAGGTVQAQTLEDLRTNTAAFYRFTDPTDITIEVKVWGSLQYPGFYEVPQGTRLSTLMTLAGGPQGGSVSGTRRTYTIRLWRPQPGGGMPQAIFETLMEDQITMLNDDPVLFSGDTIVAEEIVRQRFGWLDALSVTTAIGTIVLIIDTIQR